MSITLTQAPIHTSTLFDAEASVDELTSILEEFHAWDDDLSLKIHKWGIELVMQIPEFLEESSEESHIASIAQVEINKLRENILVDDLYKAPLTQPVTFDELVWNKTELEDYRKSTPMESFDVVYKTHSFAEKVILWMNSLPLSPEKSTPIDVVTKKFTTYSQLISNAKIEKEHLRYRDLFLRAAEMLSGYEDIMKKTIYAEVEIARQNAEEHENELNARLESIETAHQTTVDGLEARIATQGNALETRQREVKTLEFKTLSLAGEVEVLQEQFAASQREVHRLRKKLDKPCLLM